MCCELCNHCANINAEHFQLGPVVRGVAPILCMSVCPSLRLSQFGCNKRTVHLYKPVRHTGLKNLGVLQFLISFGPGVSESSPKKSNLALCSHDSRGIRHLPFPGRHSATPLKRSPGRSEGADPR